MQISQLALNEYLSDLKLKLPGKDQDKNFPSHKFLLATTSTIFHQIFQDHPIVETIILPRPIQPQKRTLDAISAQRGYYASQLAAQQQYQVNPNDLLSRVLQLAYLHQENTEQAKQLAFKMVDKKNCFSYYSLCQALGLEGVRLLFEKHVVKYMNRSDDAINLLLDAVQYESKAMKDAALDLIVPKFQEFLRSSLFFNQVINLPFEAFKSMVQRDDLQVPEEVDVFNLVYQYILQRESDPEPAVEVKKEDENLQEQNVEIKKGIEEAPKAEGDQPPKDPLEQNPPDNPPQEKQPEDNEDEEKKEEENEKKEEEAEKPLEEIPIEDAQAPEEIEDPKLYIMPDDIEEKAKGRLKNYKLTYEQKQELLLSLRLGYVSHDNLLKYSNLDVLKEFKETFLYAVSSKLNYYDSQEFLEKYGFKLEPRKSYAERVNNLSSLSNLSKSNSLFGKKSLVPSENKNDKSKLANQVGPKGEKVNPILPIQPQAQAKSNKETANLNNIIKANSNPYTLVDPLLNKQIPSLQLLLSGLTPQQQEQLPKITQQINQSELSAQLKKKQEASLSISQQSAIQSKENNKQLQNSQNNTSLLNASSAATPEFVYKHDMDDNGVLYYIGTLGKTKPYVNPHTLGQVQAFSSSIRVGKVEYFVGREVQNLSTLNEKRSFLGVDLGEERYLYPTAYTIRNRNATTYVLFNWLLEASVDGKIYIPIDKRVHYDPEDMSFTSAADKEREALIERGATSSYGIDEFGLKRILNDNQIKAFRYFRIVQISENSNQSDNLSLSGFELYGLAVGNGWID